MQCPKCNAAMEAKNNEDVESEWKDFVTVLRMFQYRFFIENPNLRDTVISIQKGFPL